MTKETIIIDSGIIELQIDQLHQRYESIHDLISFASRRNSKRGFLFVSKILGKHIPVKPSIMRQSYNDLSSMIGAYKDDTFVVGMSETATGLGGGLADSLSKMPGSKDVYFQHTTRHKIDSELWFDIEEAHTHAVSHIIYKPSADLIENIKNCKRLVLVDDEISTGKTLLQLAKGYIAQMNSVELIEVVSLVSWLDSEQEKWFVQEIKEYCKEIGVLCPYVEFRSFAKGHFKFHKNTEFNEELPKKTDANLATENCIHDLGRLGIKMPYVMKNNYIMKDKDEVNNSYVEKFSCIGTGEHLYYPFLMAEKFEDEGFDVVFQSTTRSPIFQDGKVIRNTTVFNVKRDGDEIVNHYIYNVDNSIPSTIFAESEETEKWYDGIVKNNNNSKEA